jgi:hypothetical protein
MTLVLGAALTCPGAWKDAEGWADTSPVQLYQRLPAPPRSPLPGQPREGAIDFGASTAISADRSTALVGAPGSGVWVYTRSGDTWALAQRLTAVGGGVALSADGNTVLVGAPCEHETGSVLVFARSGATWAQQGPPLTANDAKGKECGFGWTMALSSDGGTALIGDPSDGGHLGAAWVFSRSGGGWAQQGSALRPSDEKGEGSFGGSVALSADGDIVLVGAPLDGSAPPSPGGRAPEAGPGAAWIFTRSGTAWTQHQTLKPSDEVVSERGRGQFGSAVALSGDGATAMVGGEGDNEQGAAWAFTRSGGTWLQQGPKLIGAHDGSGFGGGVALSGDGATALITAVPSVFADNDYEEGWRRRGAGTAWPFTRVGSTWIREAPARGPNPPGASEEFAFSLALSAAGDTAIIGAPDGFDDPGSAWAARLAAMPANSFSTGVITIRPSATLEQELASSAAGSFSAVATVSSHTPGLITAREQRQLRRCHARRRRHRPACPRARMLLYGAGVARVAGAGLTTVVVRPVRALRRALERYQDVKVTLTIGFRPNAGPTPPAQSRVAVLELGRRESY